MSTFTYEGRDLEAMAFAPNYHRWILDVFRPYLNGRVAEVGAGSGNFTELLSQEHIQELVAVEPSEGMFPILKERTASFANTTCRKAFYGEISAEYPDYFDSMVYVNVFEHIERDAVELEYVRDSLVPGGYLCVFVPALSWLYSAHDVFVGHHRRYHKPQLKELIENAGFEVVKIRYFDILGILPWYFFLKLRKRVLSTGGAKLYDTFAVPVMRRVEMVVPVPIGKNLLVIAKKV